MKNFSRENFGKQLKLVLRESPFNQKELSEKLSVSGSAVSQMASGKMLPSKSCFGKMMKLFPESRRKEKLLQIWNYLRTGTSLFVPENPVPYNDSLWSNQKIPGLLTVSESDSSVYLINGKLLAKEYTKGSTINHFALDHECPLIDTIPNLIQGAKAAVFLRSEDVKLPISGNLLLLIADKRPNDFCKFDLIKTGEGLMLNPGSAVDFAALKIEWSLPIVEMRLLPVKED